jgi:APA family basic amino acid/polyamine antiporter
MEGPDLPRKLSLFDSTSIVVGIVIGSGIFLAPNIVAKSLPSAGLIVAAWIFAGLFTLLGALAFAELGAMMPATGGKYVYLREAYGPMVAFLCAWTFFLVIWSGTIAALAVAFSAHLSHFIPLTPLFAKVVAVALVVCLTTLNYRGVEQGVTVQNVLTVSKIAGLGILIGAVFASGEPSSLEWSFALDGFSWKHLGMAIVACTFAYDGWVAISFVAGEVKEPKRNLPLSLFLGTAILITIYLLANIAYLRILSVEAIAATERVGIVVAERAMGPLGAGLIGAAILISIAGSANGSVLAPPRVYFAQARDGLFFSKFAEVHPRFQTPSFSILCQGAWSSVLALSGSFETLITYLIFAGWVFNALTVMGVMILRFKRPELARPYKMWGYPATPILFAAISLGFIINTVVAAPEPSLIGAGLILSGIPMYRYWRRRRVETPAQAEAVGKP